MVTIKYEIYHNDRDRQTNLTKTFATLEDFGKWMLDHATPYYRIHESDTLNALFSHKYLDVDYTNYYNAFHEVGRLISRNYEMDEDYWVYLVANDNGIIYSDGTYTHGKNHVSNAMFAFLRKLENSYIYGNDDYVFID